jgi:hypothetical protein
MYIISLMLHRAVCLEAHVNGFKKKKKKCVQTFERVPRPRRVLSEMDAYHEKANRYSIHRSLLAA